MTKQNNSRMTRHSGRSREPYIGKNTIIDDTAKLGSDVTIGHNVILEGSVTIGDNTRIDHGTIIRGNVKIGNDNWIYPYCVIGTGAQHDSFKENPAERFGSRGRIVIGDSNTIREFSTVHLPTTAKQTKIGSGCYMLSYSHVAHDVIVHDNVTMANKSTLGGFVEVFDNATIGFGNNIHQYCKIGSYAMIGMGNAISKDVLPFSLINRRRFTKINVNGLLKHGVKRRDIQGIRDAYSRFPVKTAKEWYEREIRSFVKKSTRGYYPPSLQE